MKRMDRIEWEYVREETNNVGDCLNSLRGSIDALDDEMEKIHNLKIDLKDDLRIVWDKCMEGFDFMIRSTEVDDKLPREYKENIVFNLKNKKEEVKKLLKVYIDVGDKE